MKQITDIEECHTILLDITKQFVEICDRHNIVYYMLGGTMLGAVRHKGFIPWDDDMDFGVMRKDFDRLKEALEKELKFPYKLYTWRNTQNVLGPKFKIADERTVAEEFRKEGFKPMGINIDIFPLDYAKTNRYGLNKASVSDIYKRIYAYKYLPLKSRSLPKKVVAFLIKVLLFWMTEAMFESWSSRLDSCGVGPYIANNNGAWGLRETVPKEIFEKSKKYDFEDIKLNGVADYDSYLVSLYGDYMQLPPQDKRHIHVTGLYWK